MKFCISRDVVQSILCTLFLSNISAKLVFSLVLFFIFQIQVGFCLSCWYFRAPKFVWFFISLRAFRIVTLEFKVVTDCSAIGSTLVKRDLVLRTGRWWLSSQEYTFEVEYWSGQKIMHVNALSRICVNNEQEVTTV